MFMVSMQFFFMGTRLNGKWAMGSIGLFEYPEAGAPL